ncbi:hypothetical protein BCR33DRAFT_719105, partial [Rhizoclosmatium globosum]
GYVFLFIFSLLLLAVFLYFALYAEIFARKKPLSKQNLFTPFNISLFFINISLSMYTICHAIKLRSESKQQKHTLAFLIDLCQATFDICYLWFSLKRSANQLRVLYPSLFPLIQTAFLISPAPLLLPALLALIKIISPSIFLSLSEFFWYQCSEILCTVIILAFDGLLITTFIQYLQRTRVSEESVDLKFLIIARFGVVACSICGVMILLWVGNIWAYFAMPAGETYATVNAAVTIVYSVCMCLIATVLVGMKVALHWQRCEEVRTEEKRLSGWNLKREVMRESEATLRISVETPRASTFGIDK